MTTTSRFCRYELRTTDMAAARAFYADVLGVDFWGDQTSVAPLPERVIAMGGRPHWLGHIGVRDVDGTVKRIVEQGGQQRSPPGAAVAVLRDPFGAIVGVGPETTVPSRESVAWHLHHSNDHRGAFAAYSSLLGWAARESLDLGPEKGGHQAFAWDDAGRSVGSLSNIAGQSHIHPQWLYFFPVADLEAALAKVRALGGLALAPIKTFTDDLCAPCDDPQGAAFGLIQVGRPK